MAKKNADDMRNLVVALVLSMLILTVWQYYFEAPRQKAHELQMKAQQAVLVQTKKEQEATDTNTPEVTLSHAELIKATPRVRIMSSDLHGSIALTGLRFDDLTLAKYRETLDPKSPDVTLFTPAGGDNSYFAEFGWSADDATLVLPTPKTLWTASANELTPSHPVTFTWKNPAGITFAAKVTLDDHYMFTIEQSATDSVGKPVMLHSYTYVNRAFETGHAYQKSIVHEGPIGVFDGVLKELPYKGFKDGDQKEQTFDAQSGWLGISDKYWFSAIIPTDTAFTGHFSYYASKGHDHFQADYLSPAEASATVRLFAGAKELSLLVAYAKHDHIALLDRAVDFGIFYFLAKPFFFALQFFHALVGNFGIAILVLTVLVKACMFPLANKSFKSMNQMKVLQPKIAEIKERVKDDKMKLNQEMMELYKREKVNPASGCLPMFIQLPVFFALYKVLYVTIEMRQAPFYGWIHDLSIPDPTNIFTLFGMVNWQPPSFMHLGVWPLLMCATMIIQQHQSPPPPDPVQARMMKLLPIMFLFMFSAAPAGLVIYWCWSNTLTILQQWYITATHAKNSNK